MGKMVRHTKKTVSDIEGIDEFVVSSASSTLDGKRKVKNIYYDPNTKELVFDIEDEGGK